MSLSMSSTICHVASDRSGDWCSRIYIELRTELGTESGACITEANCGADNGELVAGPDGADPWVTLWPAKT